MEKEFDLDSMTPEERKAFVEMAQAQIQQAQEALRGTEMECPNCNVMAPIKRSYDHTSWTVECLCGWSAAGSGAPAMRH